MQKAISRTGCQYRFNKLTAFHATNPCDYEQHLACQTRKLCL